MSIKLSTHKLTSSTVFFYFYNDPMYKGHDRARGIIKVGNVGQVTKRLRDVLAVWKFIMKLTILTFRFSLI